MQYRVDISMPALRDAEDAFLWIREFNPTSAEAWYEGLLKSISSLEEYPERCPIAPESQIIGREIRQIIYGKRKYRIFFGIIAEENAVIIYRIWHGARDRMTKEAFEDDDA